MKERKGFTWVLIIVVVILLIAVIKVEHDAGRRAAATAYWEGHADAQEEMENDVVQARQDGYDEGYRDGYTTGYEAGENGDTFDPNP